MKDKTLVVITSALFAGTKGEALRKPLPHRLSRLQKTLAAVHSAGFDHVVVLDNTLPNAFTLDQVTFATLSEPSLELPRNEFVQNGPSRLEAVLLAQCLPYLRTRLPSFSYLLKLSAGYEVKNLPAILAKAGNGVVFRMGNPFRTKIKFCLTSFYILPVHLFPDMCTFFADHLMSMSNTKPLEYYLYRYVQRVRHQFIALPYPAFDADFLSSGRSANDLDYRLKELVFKLIAKFGLYAYQFK